MTTICRIEGCERVVKARGLCGAHYMRVLRDMDLDAPLKGINPAGRFWYRVRKGKPDECWPWTGPPTEKGYGRLRFDGGLLYAHRVAYELTHGPIPSGAGYHGVCVLHACDNPLCCNPRHLHLGSHADNMGEARVRGRFPERNGEVNPHARLTDEIVREARALYAAGRCTLVELGQRYGVDTSTIGLAVRRKTWAHVD